jgi:hypothetical protein
MKIKLLITGLFGLVTVSAIAQKGELSNAKDKFEQYDVAKMNKITASTAKSDLSDAKTSIDKASVNEKTASLPQTYAYKGAIYSALVLDTTQQATAAANFKTADEALRKARSLDSVKQENKKVIDEGFSNLEQYKFDEGRSNFQNKKYVDAYNSFNYFKQLRPDDTLAFYVVGLSAANAGTTDPKFNSIAIDNYKQLVASPTYNGKLSIYNDLATIYLANKDTADAYKTAMDGMQKFPSDNNIRNRAIAIGLQSGKTDDLTGTIEAAIASDPNNKTLYYYAGITYSEIGDKIYSKENKTKVQTAKDALEVQVIDNFTKAATALEKAMSIDPNFADASLRLSYVVMKPVTDLYNAANQLPTNQQKQYDADMVKVQSLADAAKPYVLKAVELNPNSPEALTNLKNYYSLKKDLPNANATQKKIDALPPEK